MTIRVFLMDDHELIRAGLRGFLESAEDIEVIGEAATAGEALAKIPQDPPDVAVLDVRLPDGNGIEVCREIRSDHPEIKALFLTSFTDEDGLFEAIMAGASGYLIKTTKPDAIVDAVRKVAAGQSLLDPTVTAKVLDRLRPGSEAERRSQLTEQEHKILALIGEGLTNRQIAERMFLAEKTVKNYVSRILDKLGLEHRTQAALYAVRKGSTGDR